KARWSRFRSPTRRLIEMPVAESLNDPIMAYLSFESQSLDLAFGFKLIARESLPTLVLSSFDGQIKELVEQLKLVLRGARSGRERVARLCNWFYQEQGFQ